MKDTDNSSWSASWASAQPQQVHGLAVRGLEAIKGRQGSAKPLHSPTAAEKKAGEAITGHQRRYVERLSWDHDANTRTHCWVNNFLHKDGLFPTLLPLLGDRRRNSTGDGEYQAQDPHRWTARSSLSGFLNASSCLIFFFFWQFWRKLGNYEAFWTFKLTPTIRLSVSTVALASNCKRRDGAITHI